MHKHKIGDTATLPPMEGYWDVTSYPPGGSFHRSRDSITGVIYAFGQLSDRYGNVYLKVGDRKLLVGINQIEQPIWLPEKPPDRVVSDTRPAAVGGSFHHPEPKEIMQTPEPKEIMQTEPPKVITDANGNTATVAYWGSEEEARTALSSLTGCSGCTDCTGCTGCSGCTDCTGCTGCSGCTDCSRLSGCTGCTGCSGCTDCSRLSGCTDMATMKSTLEVPVIADIHKAVFEACSKPGALDMKSFHTCETTHCRAGWVIHLAGKAGYDLEAKTSSIFAAMQIYKASGHEIWPPRFFDTEAKAMEDMRKLAGVS